VVIGVAFFLTLLPQLIYWKMMSGNYLFFSYGESERFFFDQPKFADVLFSYRKGWLLYTPIMIFALAGFFYSNKKFPKFTAPMLLYLVVTIYLTSCWWCWWYGGGFGMRPMVQSYALLVFPLCAFLNHVFSGPLVDGVIRTLKKYLVMACALFCLFLNLMQNYQYITGVLHYDAMTKISYWTIFGKPEIGGNDSRIYWSSLKDPGYDNARKGLR
jgi:hypothetical protein